MGRDTSPRWVWVPCPQCRVPLHGLSSVLHSIFSMQGSSTPHDALRQGGRKGQLRGGGRHVCPFKLLQLGGASWRPQTADTCSSSVDTHTWGGGVTSTQKNKTMQLQTSAAASRPEPPDPFQVPSQRPNLAQRCRPAPGHTCARARARLCTSAGVLCAQPE